MEQTGGLGADRGCECVGYQAHDPQGHEHNDLTLNSLVKSVKFTGGIGTVGVFVPQDPGAPDELSQQGKAVFDFGMLWFRGQKMGTGQCPVKAYNRYLSNLIQVGKATPSFVCPTNSRWSRGQRRTSTSTPGKRAGPGSSCTRRRRNRSGRIQNRDTVPLGSGRCSA
jgi:threonine dehydrogenase-like Zn-dependent dehydrogenase